jgi:hypothetical protein
MRTYPAGKILFGHEVKVHWRWMPPDNPRMALLHAKEGQAVPLGRIQ